MWLLSNGTHRDHEIDGFIKFNPKTFEHKFVEQMTSHYVNLLSQVLDQPATPLHDLQLCMWNPTQDRPLLANSVPFLPVHKLIELAAVAAPLGTAVIFEGAKLTYQDLLQQSARGVLMVYCSFILMLRSCYAFAKHWSQNRSYCGIDAPKISKYGSCYAWNFDSWCSLHRP